MIELVSNQRQSFFGSSRWVQVLVLLVMFAAALAIRVYDSPTCRWTFNRRASSTRPSWHAALL